MATSRAAERHRTRSVARQPVPARTVVWLDELQRHLTHRDEGVKATESLSRLLTSRRALPVAAVGTIWPSNLEQPQSRPAAAAAVAGAEEIRQLLDLLDSDTNLIKVPEGFGPEAPPQQSRRPTAGIGRR